MSRSSSVAIYSRSERGHRKAYIEFISAIFDVIRVGAKGAVTTRKPVLFLMIEESFVFFVFASFWRALLGRRTVGLLFRPLPAVHATGIRHRVKRSILSMMKRVPKIKVLTIVPFEIAPEFSTIADGWIYDFQLWDMSEEGKVDLIPPHGDHLKTRIRDTAKGQRVISALGLQDQNKGFDVFATTLSQSEHSDARSLLAFAGKVSTACEPLVVTFAEHGGIGINRHVTDDELFQMYCVSDAVWCLYDKGYDQASGILGRAIQFGIPAIVRQGSLSHRLCIGLGVPHVAATAENLAVAMKDAFPPRDPALGAALARRFRVESIRTLANALHVGLPV